MELHIRLEGRTDLSRQIHRQIRNAIVGGRLVRGDRVPPTRELAERLAVSRNTVSTAYDWLTAEGLLEGRQGAGSFVAGEEHTTSARRRAAVAIRHRAVWDRIEAPIPRGSPARYDFGVGTPDRSAFPYDAWRRLLARQIRHSKLDSDYGDPAGHPALRRSIAHYAAVSRGVKSVADDIIVTHGAQQAFDLIARVLISPGTAVAIEDPGYPPVRMLFESMDARVIPIRVDDAGLDVSSLPNDARVVYVTPSHQFPLGMPMSQVRRTALLEWAERRNAVIIEDDYDSEFRFGGRPLDTLQSIDRSGRVIYVGSFSKSLLPALRLGFMVAPPSLVRPLAAASHVAGWFGQWPAQAALATFIDEGLLARHVRRMRRVYSERHERILRALEGDLSRWLEPVPSVTGMHVAATLRSRSVKRERDLAAHALEQDLAFDRLSVYCAGEPRQAGVVLGYGGIPTSKIAEGLKRLQGCLTRTRQ
jgi:GntR family transcriptional regulator/MocR family aminotransferase